MVVKLIAFDMDGTALNTRHQLLPETLSALRDAREKNIILVPASGRMVSLIPEAVFFVPGIRYVIASNGASVLDRQNGEVIYSNYMSQDIVEELFERLEPLGVYLEIYSQGKVYMDSACMERFRESGMLKRYPLDFSRRLYPVENLKSYARQKNLPVEKINLPFVGSERTAVAEEKIRKVAGVTLTTSGFDNLEINAAGTSKAQALRFLSEYLSVSPEEILAVGDGLNDLEMIRFAGWGVAMGNAVEPLLAEADFVTDNNDCDGLGKAVRKALSQDK